MKLTETQNEVLDKIKQGMVLRIVKQPLSYDRAYIGKERISIKTAEAIVNKASAILTENETRKNFVFTRNYVIE